MAGSKSRHMYCGIFIQRNTTYQQKEMNCTDTHNITDEPQNNYLELQEADKKKEYTLYDYIHLKFQKIQTNLWKQKGILVVAWR